MSIGKKSFQAELQEALQQAGLWTGVEHIIGRFYQFGCEHGSHHEILVGTIKAIGLSDEGGLDFYVSNPRFWGKRLISIKYNNGMWMAYVDIKPREYTDLELDRMSEEDVESAIEKEIAARFFEGEFILL